MLYLHLKKIWVAYIGGATWLLCSSLVGTAGSHVRRKGLSLLLVRHRGGGKCDRARLEFDIGRPVVALVR